MKRVRLAVASVAMVALLGCDPVYSSAPMGEEVVMISKGDWDGFWLAADGMIAVQVVDEAAGAILISGIELTERSDSAGLQSELVYLRSSGGWLFANHVSSDAPDVWEWARLRKDGDQLVVWAPEASAFRALVSDGALPGTLTKGRYSTTVTLGELNPTHYELITSGASGVLVDWESPTVLLRIQAIDSGAPPPPPPPPPQRRPGLMNRPR